MPARVFLLLFLLFTATVTTASTIDSIGVENLEGKKVILHKIEPKETYYSLGRKYAVSPSTIIDFNNNAPLTIGLLIKVPTQRLFEDKKVVVEKVTSIPQPVAAQGTEKIIFYKVKSKETLFSISKKFNTSIEEIKTLNKLKSNSLSLGQTLKIKTFSSTANKPTVSTPNTEPVIAANNTTNQTADSSAVLLDVNVENRRLPAARYGLKEIKERGVATWIDDESLDPTKMIALHPTAPIGTIIKVTNPMTQKSTFAKVVGKFAENELNKGAIIVLTKSAADLLGSLDKRFQVNLVYGIPDEQ